jgi:lipopolysaccharide transport system permease protein
MMGMGCGILISSLTTKYRDLSVLVGFGIGLWMYATPVVYPMSQLSDGLLKHLIQLNPVTAPVELFRYAVLGVGSVTLSGLAISVSFTLLVLFLGIVVFNRVERTFMDTV